MQLKQRLRSRLILSYLLLGFGLTALFAVASVGLRNRLEDTDDWAAADAMASMDISLVSRDLAVLSEVEGALGRLADGSYGACVDCGVDIPYARLAAYPAAIRCVACQSRLEAREQARR